MFRELGIRRCQHSRSGLTALPRGEGWQLSPPLRATKLHLKNPLFPLLPQQSETQTDLQYLPNIYPICCVVVPRCALVEEEASLEQGLWAFGGALF